MIQSLVARDIIKFIDRKSLKMARNKETGTYSGGCIPVMWALLDGT